MDLNEIGDPVMFYCKPTLDAIKSLLIFNGGAVIGLLTFLGNFIKNSQGSLNNCFNLIYSLGFFVAGGALALLLCVTAYYSQRLIHESTPEQKNRINSGRVFVGISIGLALLSWLSFVFGALTGVSFFNCLPALGQL